MAVTLHFFMVNQVHLEGRFIWFTTSSDIAASWHSFCSNIRTKIKKLGYSERPIESLIETYDLYQQDVGGFESDSYVNPDGSITHRRVRTWFYDLLETIKVNTMEEAIHHLNFLADSYKTRWKDNAEYKGYNDDELLEKHYPRITGLPWKDYTKPYYDLPVRLPISFGGMVFNDLQEFRKFLCLSTSTALKIIYHHGTANPSGGTEVFAQVNKAQNPPIENPPIENPPIENPPIENPPIENPPIENPPIENPPIENPLIKALIDALADLLPQGREIAEESLIDLLEENKANLTKEEYVTCMGRGQDLLDEYFMDFQV